MNRKVAEYDHEAADYDETRFKNGMGRHLDYMHKKILESLIISSGKLVLEAGVGTGRFATWLAKKGFRVIGIDISKEMLKKTKEKKELLNVDIGLILADVHFLPFRQGLFDGCICINVLDHVSSISKFFAEVRYSIKPEGFFVFNFSNLRSPYLPIAAIVNLRKRALFGSFQTSWFTLSEVDEWLSKDGFDIKRVNGCFIASPLPLGNKLVKIIQAINYSVENSRFKSFSGSLFIRAQLTNHIIHAVK